jgi:pimeloyl-ACP methyl ester carboxylesterase
MCFAIHIGRMMKVMRGHTLFLIAVFFLASCSDDKDSDNNPRAYTSFEFIDNITAAELQLFIGNSGYDIDVNQLKYNVDIYRVVYPTTYKDDIIQASGLVILPQTTESIGMVSFQHGTISLYADAPSKVSISHYSRYLYAGLASPGFIAVVPDFLGFGESEEVLHPYYVEELSASSVVDLLKAAKDFAADKNINFNGELSLAGYSEGGYVTMAAHKYIEQNGLDGFTLLASYPAAGGFDVKGMQEYLFAQDVYDQPFYIAYVAKAYQTTYDWTQPLTDFFDEPYASNISPLFNGMNSPSQINGSLTTNITQLLNDNLIANIDTDPGYAYIRDAFIENSLTDWAPQIEMHIYQGTADETVPYENSVSTYEQLQANGASNVTLHTMEGADHSGGLEPYLESIIPMLLATR